MGLRATTKVGQVVTIAGVPVRFHRLPRFDVAIQIGDHVVTARMETRNRIRYAIDQAPDPPPADRES